MFSFACIHWHSRVHTTNLTSAIPSKVVKNMFCSTYTLSEGESCARQERDYATGLDTGCCYGDRLTAAVLPALKDLTQGRGHATGGLSRDKFGAKIISVPAHEKYYDEDPCD